MKSEIEYYEHLASVMFSTRGARFTAAHLLTQRERFSVATLALLSIFLISVSVISLSSQGTVSGDAAKFFGSLSIIASVWILVITLFDYALGRGVLAHRLHQNAIRITKLMRELERELVKASPDIERLRNLAAQYEEEIADTEVNHSPSDYKMHLFSRQKANTWPGRIFIYIRNTLYSASVFCSSVPSNLLVLCVVFGASFWYLILR